MQCGLTDLDYHFDEFGDLRLCPPTLDISYIQQFASDSEEYGIEGFKEGKRFARLWMLSLKRNSNKFKYSQTH